MPYRPSESQARLIYNSLLWAERAVKEQPRQKEKEVLVWWCGLPPDRRALALTCKRALYGIADASAFPPLDNYIRNHKAGGDGAAFDYLCFLASVRLVRQQIGLGILPKKPKKAKSPTSLRAKIALHLGEINALRADGYSWERVGMVLKRKWRRAFASAVLERSYLRKTVTALNAERASEN